MTTMDSIWFCLIVLLQLFPLVRQEECPGSAQMESYDKVWLETTRDLQPMRLKALALTFCETSKPLMVQLWTPSHNESGSYTLLWEKMVFSGRLTGQMQVINLEENEEINVSANDKLGFKVDNGETFPVFHHFDPTSGHKTFYSLASGIFTVNRSYQFVDLVNPVHFDIELCPARGCPNLGVNAVVGPKEVHERDSCQHTNLYRANGRVMLETARPLVSGTMRGFGAFYCGLSPIYIQLWEPQEGDGRPFKLVWQKRFIPPRRDGHYHIEALPTNEYIYIKPEYRLAIHSPNVFRETSVPTKFRKVGPNLVASERTRSEVQGCQVEEFGDLTFPMEFRIDLCQDPNCSMESVTERPPDSPQPASPCSPASIPGGKTDVGGEEDFNPGGSKGGVGPDGLEIFYPTPTKPFKPDIVVSGDKDKNETPKGNGNQGENEVLPVSFTTGNETDTSGARMDRLSFIHVLVTGILLVIL